MVRRLAEHRLAVDDAATAGQLLVDDRHNRRATVINDAVRPLGIFSGAALAAVVNPFLLAGGAVDSLATTAVNLWHYNRLSTPEREALARYRSSLAREPETLDAPEIAGVIRRIGEKRAKALCAEMVAAAEKALDTGELDRAAFEVHSAEHLDGCAERARKPAAAVREAQARRAAREDAARWPADEPLEPRSSAEAADYQDLLVATAGADAAAMSEAASRFQTRHQESPLAPSAAYTLVVARDLAGHGDEARTALAALADDDDSAAGRRAAALLASPDFDRLEALDAAERRHGRDRVRFVLLGGPMNGRTALYTAAQLGSDAAGAARSLGIFNVIGVLTRAWHTWRRDPVSNQAIIDRGEQLLAREPGSPEAPAVHARLADAYERAEEYGRALMHLRATPEPSQKRIVKLQGKLADQLLAEAERRDDRTLLSAIVAKLPDTKAAEKARTRLRERPDAGTTVLGRDVLRAHPALLATGALDIDPRLLDGDADNGELADSGVTLADGELRMTLEGDDGERIETRPLAPEASARARSAVQEALYADLVTADRRDPNTGRFERYVPFFIQGTVGQEGVAFYPGVKLRRYRSADQELYE